MKKIYVASSWRNEYHADACRFLRSIGYECYDFKDPAHAFRWDALDPDWEQWSTDQFIEMLQHPMAIGGFESDMSALRDCDIVVLVMPCGRSAHLEAGWAGGNGKQTIAYFPVGVVGEPELMFKMMDAIVIGEVELLAALQRLHENENHD